MHNAAAGGFSTATDIADYLVMKGHGLPRRARRDRAQSSATASRTTSRSTSSTSPPNRTFCELFDEDILRKVRVTESVEARKAIGGQRQERGARKTSAPSPNASTNCAKTDIFSDAKAPLATQGARIFLCFAAKYVTHSTMQMAEKFVFKLNFSPNGAKTAFARYQWRRPFG